MVTQVIERPSQVQIVERVNGQTTLVLNGENAAEAKRQVALAQQAVTDAGNQADAAAVHAAAAGAATRSGFVAVEAAKKSWWAGTRIADFAIDLTYGAGVGFNATSGEVDNLIDLVSGTEFPAADATRKADVVTVATPGGNYTGMLFDGGTNTRPYRGQIASLPAALRAGFSLHWVFRVSSPTAAYRPVTLSKNGVATNTQRIQCGTGSSQMQIGLYASGVSSATDSSGVPLLSTQVGAGDIAVMSVFLDGATASFYVNGDFCGNIEQALDASAFVDAIQYDFITIGGYDASGSLMAPADFLCAAQFSGASHDRMEVRDIHRSLVDRFRPDVIENVIEFRCITQSNGDTVAVGSDRPSFSKAYRLVNSSGSGYLATSDVVPAAGQPKSGNFMLWAAQEIVDELALAGLSVTPVINMLTSGGVPFTSSELWTSGNSYLGMEDEEGDRLGKISTLSTQRPFITVCADAVIYTPKFNVLDRQFYIQGFESDMSVGVPTNKVQQMLDDTWYAMKHEFGFTRCVCIEPFSRGSSASASAANEPDAENVRQGMRNFTHAHSDVIMAFDHGKDNAADWSPDGNWYLDNLTIDADGKWTSGFKTYDGVHMDGLASKALGLKAGENVLRLINNRFADYPLLDG